MSFPKAKPARLVVGGIGSRLTRASLATVSHTFFAGLSGSSMYRLSTLTTIQEDNIFHRLFSRQPVQRRKVTYKLYLFVKQALALKQSRMVQVVQTHQQMLPQFSALQGSDHEGER